MKSFSTKVKIEAHLDLSDIAVNLRAKGLRCGEARAQIWATITFQSNIILMHFLMFDLGSHLFAEGWWPSPCARHGQFDQCNARSLGHPVSTQILNLCWSAATWVGHICWFLNKRCWNLWFEHLKINHCTINYVEGKRNCMYLWRIVVDDQVDILVESTGLKS